MTSFALLCQLCNLSHREAAAYLDVRLDTVKSWSSGRNPTPDGALVSLRDLVRKIDRAAAEALKLVNETKPPILTLGYATDDAEAQSLGWPCAGAQAAAFARIIANLPEGTKAELIPRGSIPISAAASDAHEAALSRRRPPRSKR